MVKKLVDAAETNGLFQAFIPMPENVEDWYSWRVKNWGTKWDSNNFDLYCPIEGDNATITFDTAWSPPIPFYNKLVELGFDVDATYTEEGMFFAGHYENGVDNCVKLQFNNGIEWIDNIEDETLRDIVMFEYEKWVENSEEEF